MSKVTSGGCGLRFSAARPRAAPSAGGSLPRGQGTIAPRDAPPLMGCNASLPAQPQRGTAESILASKASSRAAPGHSHGRRVREDAAHDLGVLEARSAPAHAASAAVVVGVPRGVSVHGARARRNAANACARRVRAMRTRRRELIKPLRPAHRAGFVWASLSPALLTLDAFLSPAECDELIAIASSGLQPLLHALHLPKLTRSMCVVCSRLAPLARYGWTHQLWADEL